jgi:hypothetical protein
MEGISVSTPGSVGKARYIIMEKISLLFWDDRNRLRISKSFTGSYLIGDEAGGMGAEDSSRTWDEGAEWSVFQTAKGKFVVYYLRCNFDFAPQMEIYDDFKSMAVAADQGKIPRNVLAATAEELGEMYEIELDI